MKKHFSKVRLWRRLSVCMLSLVSMITLATGVSAATAEFNWTTNSEGETVAMPVSYVPTKSYMYFGEQAGALSAAQDMFYKNGLLYIADTGNNRILVLDSHFETQRILTGGETPFKSPNGVYVDDDGDVFVADTENGRIVHLAPDGTFVESFGQPKSELYDTDYAFKPMKICMDNVGQFYIINYEDYHGFIMMDALGEFKGYVAPTKLDGNILDKLVKFFATEEQKEQLDKTLPPVHTNFVMDATGALYVTTGRTTSAQLKKFLSAGDNIFPYRGSFGSGEEDAVIADVSVNDAGVVTLLESTSGKIYQYDRDGVLLTSFGGAGNWLGVNMSASSLCEDEDGNLFVLDAGTGTVTRWEPTTFIRKVHTALQLLREGRYEESMKPWQEVLDIDRNYAVARIGMGKAYVRQENYRMALEQFRIANYRAGYSEAFAGLRHELFRQYFGWVVAAVVLVGVGVYFFVRAGVRRARSMSTKL